MLAAELCIGFDLGWEPQPSRVLADLSVSDRVKEVQGWVWRECRDQLGCQLGHMCHVPSLMIRKTFLLLMSIIKPLNASKLKF